MYGLETNELMVFKENNKAFVLDKISHNNFRLSTNLELNNIVEHPNLKKTIKNVYLQKRLFILSVSIFRRTFFTGC